MKSKFAPVMVILTGLFAFMLASGAVIGISKKTDKGDTLRWVAIVLLLLASLFGTTLNM